MALKEYIAIATLAACTNVSCSKKECDPEPDADAKIEVVKKIRKPELVRLNPNGSILRTIIITRKKFPSFDIDDDFEHWIYYKRLPQKSPTGEPTYKCYWVDTCQPLLADQLVIPIPDNIRKKFDCVDPTSFKRGKPSKDEDKNGDDL